MNSPHRTARARRPIAAPYLFVAPFFVLFAVFVLYPLARSLVLSFYRSAGPAHHQFVGLGNYAFLVRDWLFWRAAFNTLLYTLLFVGMQVPASLGLALLLNSPRVRFRALFRFAFFSSHLVGNVFVATLFLLLLAPRQGAINRAIGALLPSLGTEINWRGSATLAIPAMVILGLWLSVGWGMIYLLAALQAVERELYDAAEIDGAGALAKFRHVTLPRIRPTLWFLILIGTIGSLQLFEMPYVFFDGPGPGFAGMTIVMYLYQQGFEAGNIGYAAAVGWALVVIIFIVAMIQLWIARRRGEVL